MNAVNRLVALRHKLAEDDAPAILVTALSNLRYLTGFEGVIDTGINGACLVGEGFALFYTDHRYAEAAAEAASGTPWEVRVQREDIYVEICEDLHAMGIDRVLVESSMPYGRFTFVSEHMHGSVRAVDHYVEELRQAKEPQEIERIAEAASLTDAGYDFLRGYLRPGLTEREVAFELECHMRREGSDGIAFDIIVASGPNAARPHAIPGDRVLERGDLVIVDFGARCGEYCADMTRTFIIGRADDEQRRIYDAVLAANEAGLTAVRAGMPCADVDRQARDVLEAAGLGERFTHGLGHGVGLDVHELPTLSGRSRESLRVGMVVTVEPGVYVEGFGGVRIEDLVVVEQTGCRLLSHAPKQLVEI